MLPVLLYVSAVAALVAAVVYLLFIRPAHRRRELVNKPAPPAWQSWIADAVPFYGCFDAPWRRLLEDRIKVFVVEKAFYGCDGQPVEDRHRVTIAAQACLLSLAQPMDSANAVQAILLYPSAFRVPGADSSWISIDQNDMVNDDEDIRLGESWEEGRIILSWQDIEAGIAARKAGAQRVANVVLHEFAHQFDQVHGISAAMESEESGPALQLGRAFADLQQAVEAGEDTLLDPYGASDPAEFVAVLTETFFEHPLELLNADAPLYATVSQIYRLDLAAFVREGSQV